MLLPQAKTLGRLYQLCLASFATNAQKGLFQWQLFSDFSASALLDLLQGLISQWPVLIVQLTLISIDPEMIAQPF